MKIHQQHSSFQIRLLRHASIVIEVNGKKILVDPMLSKKGIFDPIANASRTERIPMVNLPITDTELDELLASIDAVLVTHTHRDHWDIAAQEKIAKDKLILCQPADVTKIKQQGFLNVQPIENSIDWEGIHIHRTNGQHGTGEIGKKMGIVSGYVLEYADQCVYMAGDTIWCKDVQDAILAHIPTTIIVNGGGAQFLEGAPITMTIDDVIALSKFTKAFINVVHLETVNHCLQRRQDFKDAIYEHNLSKQIAVPDDGAWLNIS